MNDKLAQVNCLSSQTILYLIYIYNGTMPAWDDDCGISVVRFPDQFYVNFKVILDYNPIMWINIDSDIFILPIFICLKVPVEGTTPRETKEITVFLSFLIVAGGRRPHLTTSYSILKNIYQLPLVTEGNNVCLI